MGSGEATSRVLTAVLGQVSGWALDAFVALRRALVRWADILRARRLVPYLRPWPLLLARRRSICVGPRLARPLCLVSTVGGAPNSTGSPARAHSGKPSSRRLRLNPRRLSARTASSAYTRKRTSAAGDDVTVRQLAQPPPLINRHGTCPGNVEVSEYRTLKVVVQHLSQVQIDMRSPSW